MTGIYSELLELLCPGQPFRPQVCFGTLSGIAPLTVTVGDADIARGLLYARGTEFDETDIGSELALLPWEGGFVILFPVEGGTT